MSNERLLAIRRLSGISIALVIVVSIVVGFFIIGGLSFQGKANADTKLTGITATPSPTATPSATDPACEPAYTQEPTGHTGNKVDDKFAQEYAEATVNAGNMSEEQIQLLLERSGKDAFLLASWAHPFGLIQDPNAWQDLVSDGCLSSKGIKLHNQFEGALTAKGTVVTEAEAPADGHNSGVSDGVYGIDASQGVNGDRKAIKITLKDGTVVYIMVRCGNVVYPSKPSLPSVPTDNPPPPCVYNPQLPSDSSECVPPATPVCEPPTPHGTWPLCKDDYVAGPGPSGNAPIGSGPSEDPGPGTFIPPEQMEQPPAAPYEPPAEPAPAPPVTGPAPVPDPAPAPAPEPEAPAPSDPVPICIIPPGKTSC